MRGFVWAALLGCAAALSVDYCIVGAGPGGLQLAELLRMRNVSHAVLERRPTAGSWFGRFPVARQLISINKRFVGTADDGWTWRHDWNSLLNGRGLRLGRYTPEYYPHADHLERYLRDFAAPLNVRYNYTVRSVRRVGASAFEINGGEWECRKGLVVATGLSRPHVPPGLGGAHLATLYQDFDISAVDQYRNKSILILGNGNSGFELADLVLNEAAYIHVAARHHVKLSFLTHYVGHVRAVNSRFLDHYQLKSLDGLLILDANKMELYRRPDGKIGYFVREEDNDVMPADYDQEMRDRGDSHRDGYDHVFLATGWRPECAFFNDNVKPEFGEKYPAVLPSYESVNEPGVWFVGALMHSLDVHKSAGGFIHGFRYLTKAVADILTDQVAEPSHVVQGGASELADHFLDSRVNSGHNSYQMFSIIGDVAVLPKCGFTTSEFPVYHNVLLKNLHRYPFAVPGARLAVFAFDYGPYHHGPAILTPHVAGEAHPQESGFLHPIFREYAVEKPKKGSSLTTTSLQLLSEFHIIEDFLTRWDSDKLHRERMRAKLADMLACKRSHLLEPAEVLNAELYYRTESADFLANQLASTAQQLLFNKQPKAAHNVMMSALDLWHDRPDKQLPVLAFLAFLENNVTRLTHANTVATQVHSVEVGRDMLSRALEETAILLYGDGDLANDKVGELVQATNDFIAKQAMEKASGGAGEEPMEIQKEL